MTPADKERLLAKFNGNSPADAATIRQCERQADFRLPEDYVHFLHQADGGEGFIGNAYAIFWRVDELVEMNKTYDVSKYAPGLFLFGSDGGGEAFAFDTRTAAMPIVSVPFVGMELDMIRPLGSTFTEFLEKLFTS
jgi:hypothetical protein